MFISPNHDQSRLAAHGFDIERRAYLSNRIIKIFIIDNMRAHQNNKEKELNTVADLSEYINQIDITENIESWIYSLKKESLCLIKSGDRIFLMYLDGPEDVGVVSGNSSVDKVSEKYLMANGQEDEFPISWCIEKSVAYNAIEYFFNNSGRRPPQITWHAG